MLLCPWDSPGKNTGVGCHALRQGIFPTQGSNLCLLCTGRQILYHQYYWEAGGFYRGVEVKKRSMRLNPSLSHVLTQKGTSGHRDRQTEEMTQRQAGESIILLSQMQSSNHEYFFSIGPPFSEGLG